MMTRALFQLRIGLCMAAAAVAGCFGPTTGQAPDAKPDLVTLDLTKPGPGIAPGMYGVFYEDINFAADGGLYPERVKNRSFEFTEPLAGWSKITQPFGAAGEVAVRTEGAMNPANPHYVRMRGFAKETTFGISNTGFRGMGVEAGGEYTLSAYVRVPTAGVTALTATVKDARGQSIATAALSGFTAQWARYEATVKPSATDAKASLDLVVTGAGPVDVDMVSLYPKDNWGRRPNGLRRDLVQLLADMKPGFLRFPGGCIVEGRRLALRYEWKKTVGDISQRTSLVNRWNDEFAHRPTPDYFQTFGLGFYEYFQLAEDIGAAPLPILNCGMACQFNSAELAPLDDLQRYIQDALDLVDFANGPVTGTWGAMRAQMGHPAPFNLKMIGVGNEQWGPDYVARYERFAAALKKVHPEISLVSSAGPSPMGDEFDYLWSNMRRLKADLIDEHYYQAPTWFFKNVHRYDKYDRTGPKVFAGEYAAQTSGTTKPDNRNNWQGAISEAAFMTGLDRNADVVRMASYAPLFGHVDGWQWTPNLIWFDNLRSYGTPNYYVQKMFATNQGTNIARVTVNGSEQNAEGELYTSAVTDQPKGEAIVKFVNPKTAARRVRVQVDGAKGTAPSGQLVVLASSDLAIENSLDQPKHFVPVEKSVTGASGGFDLILEPQSFTVLRVKYTK
jgi:alpha-L-arabinofuranosidase